MLVRGHPHAFVVNDHQGEVLLLADLDSHRCVLRAELDGIADEFLQQLPHEVLVGHHRRRRLGQIHLEVRLALAPVEPLADLRHQPWEVYLREVQLQMRAGLQAREHQQVLDDAAEALRLPGRAVEQGQGLLVGDMVARLQRLEHALDDRDGRTQFVGDHGDEAGAQVIQGAPLGDAAQARLFVLGADGLQHFPPVRAFVGLE